MKKREEEGGQEEEGSSSKLKSRRGRGSSSKKAKPRTQPSLQQNDALVSSELWPYSFRPNSRRKPLSFHLYNLLQRDIEPNGGPHLFPPFFTTKDLLSLSECAKPLVRYHHLLTRVRLRKPFIWWPIGMNQEKQGDGGDHVMRLVSQQQAGLSYLQIQESTTIHILSQHHVWRYMSTVKVLRMPRLMLRRDEVGVMGGLAEALSQGHLRNLEELNIQAQSFGDDWPKEYDMLSPLMMALSGGACPGLLRLRLADFKTTAEPAVSQAIATALGSGRLNHLKTLDLSSCLSEDDSIVRLCQQLETGCCPGLRELTLSRCISDISAGQALAQALLSGCCMRLEKLDVSKSFWPDALVPVFEALEVQSCPQLQALNITSSCLMNVGSHRLGRALYFGGLQQLKRLDLTSVFRHSGSDEWHYVLDAIVQGVYPALSHLIMTSNNLLLVHGQALGQALGNGCMPNLEVLMLGENKRLGDGGVMAIMEGINMGKTPNLKIVCLNEVGMEGDGVVTIAHTMTTGAMKNLQQLRLATNPSVSDEGIKELVQAIDSKCCPRLRKVSFPHPGIATGVYKMVLESLNKLSGKVGKKPMNNHERGSRSFLSTLGFPRWR